MASRGKAGKDDTSKAKAVLALAGVTPADPRVGEIGAYFRNIEATVAKLKAAAQPVLSAAQKAALHRDYRAMGRALEGVRLTTAQARSLRACFFLPEPQPKPFRPRDDLRILDRFVAGLRFGKPSGKRKGHPVDEQIKCTLRAFGTEYGWSWQVCAAALFVSGASKSYAAIKKTLREWVARNKDTYADTWKLREAWTKRPGISD